MSAANPLGSASLGSGDQRPYEPSMEEILASIRRIIADDQSLAGRNQSAEPAPPVHEVHAGDMQSNEELFREELGSPLPREPAPAYIPLDDSAGEHEHADAAPSSFDEPTDEAPPEDEAMMAHGHIAAPQYPMPLQAEGGEAEASALARTEPQVQHMQDHAWGERLEPAGQAESAHRVAAPALAQGVSHTESPASQDASEPADPAAQLFSAQTRQSVSAAFNALAATRLADNSEELLDIARDMIRPLLKVWLDDNLPGMVERLIRAEIERVARGR